MKTCFKCGRALALTEFYPHPRMADGHLNKCRACTRRDVRVNRAKRSDYYDRYDRDRYHADVGQRRTVRSRGGDPQKRRARIAVGNALRDGVLQRRPCEVCGAARAEAHHEDYTRPLDVRWLCKRHHAQRHRTDEDLRLFLPSSAVTG